MKVKLYRNLSVRDKRAWSLVALEGPRKGRVIKVVGGAVLKDAKFVVGEAGRQRVIREKRKNVHAFITGELVRSCPKTKGAECCAGGALVSYDPYKGRTFKRQGKAIKSAGAVTACARGVFAKR